MRRIGHEALNAQLHTRTVAGSAKEIELMSVASAALFLKRKVGTKSVPDAPRRIHEQIYT